MEYNIVPSENQQKMTIKGKPETIVIVVLSIFFSAFISPLLAFPFVAYSSLYSIGTKTLTCEHNIQKKVICKEVSEHLLGYAKSEETTFQNITRADFHLTANRKGRAQQWISLTANEKERNIFYESGYLNLNLETEELTSWVTKFNQFVDSRGGKIELTYPASSQWGKMLLPLLLLLFPIVGLGLIYFLMQWHSLTFDRDERSLNWEVQTIFGRKRYQFSLIDISEITLTKTRGSKGGIIYYIKIYMSERKKPIPLTFISITNFQNIAQSLSSFLQINVQDLTDRWS
jgi:hypothetical protein